MKKQNVKEVIPGLIPVWEVHTIPMHGGWLKRNVFAVFFHEPSESELSGYPKQVRVGKYRVMQSPSGKFYRVNDTPVTPGLIIGPLPRVERKQKPPSVPPTRRQRFKLFLVGLVSGDKVHATKRAQ